MTSKSIFKKLVYYGLAILVIVLLYVIISDWEHFKAGLLGKPPL